MNQPWKAEPNRVEWIDPATKLPCLMIRNDRGVWCGYVGVTQQCHWWRVPYDRLTHVQAHGGLTYTDRMHKPITEPAVLHQMLELGMIPDDLWWVGFDCNHWGDLAPTATFPLQRADGKVYRDLEYVTAEVVNLALQAAAACSR